MSNRYDYVKYDDESVKIQAAFKKVFSSLSEMVDLLDAPRAKAIAQAKLEEAYMWVGKAIRDAQIKEVGAAELQERRKDS